MTNLEREAFQVVAMPDIEIEGEPESRLQFILTNGSLLLMGLGMLPIFCRRNFLLPSLHLHATDLVATLLAC